MNVQLSIKLNAVTIIKNKFTIIDHTQTIFANYLIQNKRETFQVPVRLQHVKGKTHKERDSATPNFIIRKGVLKLPHRHKVCDSSNLITSRLYTFNMAIRYKPHIEPQIIPRNLPIEAQFH